MSGIKESISECIGNTPCVYLHKLPKDCKAKIAVKMETENPAKSVKDRLGLAMIKFAEEKGVISPGKNTLVEATSGNTGIALAMLGAALGYKVILTMPASMSIERRCLLAAYGAKIVLTPGSKGMKGAINMANKIVAETEGAVLTEQFKTPANAKVHEETTGPEIWKATDGKLDVFVAGVGTGGTITGCARYFKSQGSSCKIVAVEPAESPVLSGGKPGPHKIQGIGAGFKPDVLDTSVIDEVVQVTGDEAMASARRLALEEGIFCGISSGASVAAAIKVGSKPENEGKLVVCILPSFGERYLSTAMFDELKSQCEAMPVCSEEECM
ncbi:Cysteine synthase [Diplonema papillatum]|nr:Cysteine synthase [Diplonema papillatum]